MAGLTCELCGESDFIKEDGLFVCQSCGCKYTLEEAQKIMNQGSDDTAESSDNNEKIDALLELAFVIISKHLNRDESMVITKAMMEADSEEVNKYLDNVEEQAPGNWKLWFYKGIWEELCNPTYSDRRPSNSFTYFQNAMRFADDNEKKERILPVVERLKQMMIQNYRNNNFDHWRIYDYYPLFLRVYASFYNLYEIAADYSQKTAEDWSNLESVFNERHKAKEEEENSAKIKEIEEDIDKMNRYKVRIIENMVEVCLFPQREEQIKSQIEHCRFFEGEKKADLEKSLNKLAKDKEEAAKTADDISTKAFILMKKYKASPPSWDIWGTTLMNLITEYVEQCYVSKPEPSEEDANRLNEKLSAIGFGTEYYIQ